MSENITLNQEENNTTEELLKILESMQDYSINAMQIKNRLDLFELTVNSIAHIFKQPKVFLFDIDPKTKIVTFISAVGFDGLRQRDVIGVYPKVINHLSILEWKDVPELKTFFASLNVENALVCELNREDLGYSGVFICGFTKTDLEPCLIPTYQRESFRSLIQKAGMINYLLRQNERLVREVEERKDKERIIKEQAIQLRRSNEDLEQFAYVISHDLKAPLRNITSFAQLLKHSFSEKLGEDAREYLGFIMTGVKQFGALIDDVLLYSRAVKNIVEFEQTELDLVVESAKYNLRLMIEETGTIINYGALPELNVNFLQMTQVFQNLISNAIKFRQKDIKPIITIEASTDDERYVAFRVSDNGIGIEAEYFERIFALFQRLHIQTEYEGTGLGLSICKKIVERHRGSIWVESKGLNKGTTFCFLIQKDLKNE